jgi:hypothetical protein
MTLRWLVVSIVAVATVMVILMAQIANPCSGDLTGTAPAIEHQHDLERSTLSARAAAALTEAVSSCGMDPDCVTRTTEMFTRFEADALGAKAREQRDALRAECLRRH